jgi:ribosomal protein S6--L-glutamate ligase
MEVNASPGLEGIEATTRVDVAGEIIDFVVQKVKKISAYQREQRWKVKR